MRLELIKSSTNGKGDKPNILFVHGMWHGAWVWEPYFLPYFEELGYAAYAVSLSNHANSPRKKALNLLRINDYVNDLEETINSMDSTPILVGHSMGGFIVQKYLEKNKVPGAILMAPVPPFGIWAGTINVLKKFPLIFLKANITLTLKVIINSPIRYRHILGSDNIKDEDINDCLRKINSESYLAYLDMLAFNLVIPDKIDSPLLIIGGAKDNAVPLRALKKTAVKYKVTPVIFENMAHNLMFEPEYKKVADEINKWILAL